MNKVEYLKFCGYRLTLSGKYWVRRSEYSGVHRISDGDVQSHDMDWVKAEVGATSRTPLP